MFHICVVIFIVIENLEKNLLFFELNNKNVIHCSSFSCRKSGSGSSVTCGNVAALWSRNELCIYILSIFHIKALF
jgi:hypothetical protein